MSRTTRMREAVLVVVVAKAGAIYGFRGHSGCSSAQIRGDMASASSSTQPADRCRIKVCGITRAEDAICVSAAGADALGLVFYQPSPRCVDVDSAARICQVVPPFISIVALFVDARPALIHAVLEKLPIAMLQFHGNETAGDCERYDRPYLKALRVRPGFDPAAALQAYPSASGFLLDTYRQGVAGGTGECFDWSLFPQSSDKPLILAGGLQADNVAQAIRQTRPYAVDVSGGVESVPGVKDATKVRAFVRAVQSVS